MSATRSPARLVVPGSRTSSSTPAPLHLLREPGEGGDVAAVGADGERAAVLLGDVGHRLPVDGGGGVEERLAGGGAAGERRVERRRVGAHEHERQAGGGRAGRGHGRGVGGGVAAGVLHG